MLALACACSKPAAPPPENAAGVRGSAGAFLGSESCRECHGVEFQAWSKSAHRRTLRAVAGGEPLRLAAASLGSGYRVGADGAVEGPGPQGEAVRGQAAYLVGGSHREDLVVRMADGRMQVFPWSLDLDRGEAFEPLAALAGGASPPPDVIDFWTRAGRNASLTCYGCHATGQALVRAGVSPDGVTVAASRWIEPGVGCEGCHGPGGPHREAVRASRPVEGTIRMPRGDRGVVDGCAACHGLRDVLASPFSDDPAHRYGAAIYEAADPVLTVSSNFEFHEPFFGDLRPATFQQEAIAFSQSGCARRGGLTCAACHDVHSGAPSPALAAADGGDAICARCHAEIVGRGTRHTLHAAGSPGGRCLDCHMASILRGPAQKPARDHSMAPPVATTGRIPAACASCHAGAVNAPAIAAAWQKVSEGSAARRRRELGLAVDGAETDDGRRELARRIADPDSGWFIRWAAMRRLQNAATAKRTDAIAAALHAALADSNPALRREAARALGRFGRPSDFTMLEQASRDADPWAALAAVLALARLRAPTAAARLPEVMQRPDLVADARAQYAYGNALLVARDWKRAEAVLRRALELNPMMVGAISDLGLAAKAQGRPKEAEAAWRTALALNPRFESARQNLANATSSAAEPPRQD